MTTEEQQRILQRLGLLMNMSEARGCTEHEAANAQLKIGQAVQKYNLTLSFGTPHSQTYKESAPPPPPPHEKPRRERPREDAFEHEWVKVIAATEKALLLRNQDSDEYWIPKSQLRNDCRDWDRGDEGMLYCSRWWARKEEWSL